MYSRPTLQQGVVALAALGGIQPAHDQHRRVTGCVQFHVAERIHASICRGSILKGTTRIRSWISGVSARTRAAVTAELQRRRHAPRSAAKRAPSVAWSNSVP